MTESIRSADADVGFGLPEFGPRSEIACGNPPYVIEYMTAVEFKVRRDSTAAASFAVIFECIKLGIAIAAIIKMIVTTIKSSIREKPLR